MIQVLFDYKIPCFYSTDCGFAPHGEMVYTGTSFDDENESDGMLVFLTQNPSILSIELRTQN